MSAGLNPALVTRGAAQRMPRLALLLFCAAYVLPGVVGRDPWRNADAAAFGQMLSLAEGRSPWLTPMLGGVPTDAAALPHWLGAAFIAATSPWLDPALAARIPFALLLALSLAALWYAAYHLARTDAAQPLAFAFGGEAAEVDYARAIADAAVLALIATLGLLQLGHETTPELAQLAAMAGVQWSLAVATRRPIVARAGILLTLPALAASGAPAIACLMGFASIIVCLRSSYAHVRLFTPWTIAATLASAATAWFLGAWAWRIVPIGGAPDLVALGRQWLWFLWPAWPLALWTLWRWRSHLLRRHLAVPLAVLVSALAASVAMNGSDRALMLALPGLAVLAAFALPTLRRSASAAIDWFSVFFFTLCALTIWVVYISLHTGMPPKPAANVFRLLPGFMPQFSAPELVFAALATLAWLWLVRWRTGRHRVALWKSQVLPAGGVALSWALLMTLWLPMLDYARSYRPHVNGIVAHLRAGECLSTPNLPLALVAALEYQGRRQVDRRPLEPAALTCPVLLRPARLDALPPPPPGWREVARVGRPSDRFEVTLVYRRAN